MIGIQRPRIVFFASVIFLLSATLTLFFGCDSNVSESIDTVAVRGQVLLDELPLSGARVTFIPISATDSSPRNIKPMSYGVTDAEGNYKLQQADGTFGAAKGQHMVMISKPLDSDEAQFTIDSKANAVPEFYRQYGYLQRHVMPLAGGQKIDFKLSTIDPLLK